LIGVLPAGEHQSCLIIPGEFEEWRGGLPGFQGRGRSNGARRPVPSLLIYILGVFPKIFNNIFGNDQHFFVKYFIFVYKLINKFFFTIFFVF